MDALMIVKVGLGLTLFLGSTWAQGQNEVGILVADHRACVVWLVVGGSASRLPSWAGDVNAGWEACVVGHGWHDLHTALGERIAVDVGEIVVDHAVVPGVFELRDCSGKRVVRGKLNRHADVWLVIGVVVASRRELLHILICARDSSIVNRETAVVIDGCSTNSQDRWSQGKQHGCAGDGGRERHCW